MNSHGTHRQIYDCEQKGDDHKTPPTTFSFGLLQAFNCVVSIATDSGTIEIIEQCESDRHEDEKKD